MDVLRYWENRGCVVELYSKGRAEGLCSVCFSCQPACLLSESCTGFCRWRAEGSYSVFDSFFQVIADYVCVESFNNDRSDTVLSTALRSLFVVVCFYWRAHRALLMIGVTPCCPRHFGHLRSIYLYYWFWLPRSVFKWWRSKENNFLRLRICISVIYKQARKSIADVTKKRIQCTSHK